MLSVKLTTLKKTKTLRINCLTFPVFFFSILISGQSSLLAQDNSPYSRYGIGDLVPSTGIISRGMGSISAAYSDPFSINFNNPASYANFQSFREPKSKKMASGRVLLDVGINIESRGLKEKNVTEKFTASNALFSHLQVGIPLRENWGMSFGLRPVTRISYKIDRFERLFDPITQLPIDSAQTQFAGTGGAYLASFGAGHKFNEHFSIGINTGYLFGEKDYSTRRALINDTVSYQQSNYQTKTSFGKIYLNAGLLYHTILNKNKNIELTLGAYGSLKTNMKASMDVIHETFIRDPSQGDVRVDSVSEQKDIQGTIVYPSTYGFGFMLEKPAQLKKGGWIFGLDFVQTNWSQYRFYNQLDSVQNKWELRAGAQLWPASSKSFFSNILYRLGFFVGPDYIKIINKIPQFGFSAGLGIPLKPGRGFGRNQSTLINLAMEYIKRGNSNNLIKENMFRLSVGLSLSDIWFIKRKYE
jgi:hypothetical protein